MIVDTSVWIDFFNGHPSAQAQRLNQAIADNEPIAIPGLVLTEILLGLRNDSEAKRIANLLEAFTDVAEPSPQRPPGGGCALPPLQSQRRHDSINH